MPARIVQFPLKARYDQARYQLPPLLMPPASTETAVTLPGMQLAVIDDSSSPTPCEADSSPPLVASVDDMDPEEACGACPHFATATVEEREVGVKWWPPPSRRRSP